MSIQQSAQKHDAQAALATTIQPDMTLKTEPVIRIPKWPEGTTKVPVTETQKAGPVMSILKRPETTKKVTFKEPQRAEPMITILKQPEETTEIRPAETPTACIY